MLCLCPSPVHCCVELHDHEHCCATECDIFRFIYCVVYLLCLFMIWTLVPKLGVGTPWRAGRHQGFTPTITDIMIWVHAPCQFESPLVLWARSHLHNTGKPSPPVPFLLVCEGRKIKHASFTWNSTLEKFDPRASIHICICVTGPSHSWTQIKCPRSYTGDERPAGQGHCCRLMELQLFSYACEQSYYFF